MIIPELRRRAAHLEENGKEFAAFSLEEIKAIIALHAADANFVRQLLEIQHIPDRLKKSRLCCYDLLIEEGYGAGEAFTAACQIIQVC